MKKEVEVAMVGVPPETRDLLKKASEADPLKLTLGQMVTKLAFAEYGHLANVPTAEKSASPEATQIAEKLLEKGGGDRFQAVRSIPVGHPLKDQVYNEIQRLSQEAK